MLHDKQPQLFLINRVKRRKNVVGRALGGIVWQPNRFFPFTIRTSWRIYRGIYLLVFMAEFCRYDNHTIGKP